MKSRIFRHRFSRFWSKSCPGLLKFRGKYQKFFQLYFYTVDAIHLIFFLVQLGIICNRPKKSFLIFSIFSILLEQFSYKVTRKSMPKHDILHSEPLIYGEDEKSSEKYRKNRKHQKRFFWTITNDT